MNFLAFFIVHRSSFIVSMRLRLLYNPAAGRGRAKAHVRDAEDFLRAGGATVETQASASPEDMTKLAAESFRGGYCRVLPQFVPYHVKIDGKRDAEIMFAAIGNSRQYGGGIRITPDAKIDDGLLDACIVHKTSRMQLLKTLPRAYTGAHVKSPFVEVRRATEFTFTSERELEVYADGEKITKTPVKFALAAEKLRFAAP